MPLAGSDSIVGGLISAALLTPVAAANWTSVAGVFSAWLPTNTVVLPGTMTAAGAAVTGTGTFEIAGDEGELGTALALAAGSPPTDTAAVDKWTAVAGAVIAHITDNGQALPSAFVSPGSVVSPNPITGTGTLSFTSPIGTAIAVAMGTTDAPGIAGWLLVGGLIQAHLQAFTQVVAVPGGFTAPAGGGPLVGAGAIL